MIFLTTPRSGWIGEIHSAVESMHNGYCSITHYLSTVVNDRSWEDDCYIWQAYFQKALHRFMPYYIDSAINQVPKWCQWLLIRVPPGRCAHHCSVKWIQLILYLHRILMNSLSFHSSRQWPSGRPKMEFLIMWVDISTFTSCCKHARQSWRYFQHVEQHLHNPSLSLSNSLSLWS